MPDIGQQQRHRLVNIATWILCVLAAAAFIASGAAKLLGVPQMVELFGAIGAGQWFRYLTAVVEIGAGLGLLVPRISPWAALALAATMIGAIFTHLVLVPSSPIPAFALLAVVLTIAWLRRDRLGLPHIKDRASA